MENSGLFIFRPEILKLMICEVCSVSSVFKNNDKFASWNFHVFKSSLYVSSQVSLSPMSSIYMLNQ